VLNLKLNESEWDKPKMPAKIKPRTIEKAKKDLCFDVNPIVMVYMAEEIVKDCWEIELENINSKKIGNKGKTNENSTHANRLSTCGEMLIFFAIDLLLNNNEYK
jgi:hypothetical protein